MANVARRLWRQIWEQGGDPDEPGLALAAAREVAVPEAVLQAGLDDPRSRQLLKRVTRRAAERGVREVPAVFFKNLLFQGEGTADELERRLGDPGRASTGPGDSESRPTGGMPDWTFSG